LPDGDTTKRLAALEKVLQISRDMVATSDLDELLGLIVQRSMELLEAERASLFLYDRDSDELVSKIAAGEEEIRFPANLGIAGAVARTREVLNVPDAYADARFNREVDRRTGFRTRNILALPLIDHEGELVGVLEVLNKRRGGAASGAFTPDDVALAETLGAQAGVVLQRARLLEHYVQKQRMEHALQIARQIQQDLLPAENPRLEGFDVAGWSTPAEEAGGDMYDFQEIAPGRWTLTVADATGHGIGPALVIAEARAMLRVLSEEDLNIPSVLSKVNDLLARDLSESRFVTCFFGLLETEAARIRYASAGQGPMLLYRRDRDAFEELPATALPLGVMAGADFAEQQEHLLEPGDILAVLTDGFFEACDAQGRQFGTERICTVIRDRRDLPAPEIIDGLREAVLAFTGNRPQEDDLTAVIVRRR